MLVHLIYLASALVALLSTSENVAERSLLARGDSLCSSHAHTPRDMHADILTFKSPEVIPEVGAATNIPEFNDCQALILEDGSYGPVVAVYARHSKLPPLRDSRWPLVAVIYNAGMLDRADVPYNPLLIALGYSCVYLPLTQIDTLHTMQAAPHPPIAAHIIYNRDEKACAGDINAPNMPNLVGKVRPKLAQDTVPIAARWEWDSVGSTQYIGVHCRSQWCEIGRAGFQSARDPDLSWVNSVDGLQRHQVHRVRAYFDEQNIAVKNPSGGGGTRPLIPSGARATFFSAPPSGQIKDKQGNHYVGTIILDKTIPAYAQKWGTVKGTPTHVYFNPSPEKHLAGGLVEYTVYLKTGARVKPLKVKHRRDDPRDSINVPPIVRWRWIFQDETTWMRCLEGCCTTQ